MKPKKIDVTQASNFLYLLFLLRVQTTNNIGTDGRAEIYASRRMLAPSVPISKKSSENNLHNLLHTKSMNSTKKTFTFSTSGSSGKLPQLADDNMVIDASDTMEVEDADSDESEEEEEEEEKLQGVSEHTSNTSPSKANSLHEKSRTVTFSSGSFEGTENRVQPTSRTSQHGNSNKGVLTKAKSSKNAAKVKSFYSHNNIQLG
jgi:hypothetical protein